MPLSDSIAKPTAHFFGELYQMAPSFITCYSDLAMSAAMELAVKTHPKAGKWRVSQVSYEHSKWSPNEIILKVRADWMDKPHPILHSSWSDLFGHQSFFDPYQHHASVEVEVKHGTSVLPFDHCHALFVKKILAFTDLPMTAMLATTLAEVLYVKLVQSFLRTEGFLPGEHLKTLDLAMVLDKGALCVCGSVPSGHETGFGVPFANIYAGTDYLASPAFEWSEGKLRRRDPIMGAWGWSWVA